MSVKTLFNYSALVFDSPCKAILLEETFAFIFYFVESTNLPFLEVHTKY